MMLILDSETEDSASEPYTPQRHNGTRHVGASTGESTPLRNELIPDQVGCLNRRPLSPSHVVMLCISLIGFIKSTRTICLPYSAHRQPHLAFTSGTAG